MLRHGGHSHSGQRIANANAYTKTYSYTYSR
jgi:hypothetical protein